jgi:hypothetical protein
LPEQQWKDKADFFATLTKLGKMFLRNFEHFHDGDAFVGEGMALRIMSGGPVLPAAAALADATAGPEGCRAAFVTARVGGRTASDAVVLV